jgi:tetratricopeptide (TPR) repeat protein
MTIHRSYNVISESRMLFEELIFDWTDKYTESIPVDDVEGRANAVDKIASLWVEYATFEQRLRQWKKVVQVFENALNDEVTSKSRKVYVAYANFCKVRGKIANAQKVYLRALCSPLADLDHDRIWVEFLKAMQENGSPDITYDQLYTAASSQPGYELLKKPRDVLLSKVGTN